MLKNECLLAEIGVDTAENGPEAKVLNDELLVLLILSPGDPSHVHCASWKHLHAHRSIGAAEHKESATFVVTMPIFFMQIGLHSKSVSSQPQNGAEASRRRA